jgi:serine/threonine protein kinase
MAKIVSASQDFVTEGERKAATILQQLPPSWYVICNKTLPRNGRSYEMDFIIIGDHWIFLLDEKSWRGKIRGNDELWVFADGSSERSPLGKVDYVAKVLAGHIYQHIPALKQGGHCVKRGILLSAASELPTIYDQRAKEGIFLLNDVCQRLVTLDKQQGNLLFQQYRERIQQSLINLSQRPAVPNRIHNYMIEDVVALRPGVRLFRARMEDNDEPRLLMVYDLGRNPLEAAELRKFYLHEFQALRELRATGLVPEVSDPVSWSEDYLVLPIVPLTGKPLSTQPIPETQEELAQELLLASACFKGLDTIHAKGLLHRALEPDTIYVLSGGQTPKIAFTNLFAARISTQTIASQLDKLALAIEDPYAHFDLAIGYEFANKNTDIFSLALIFLVRIAGVSLSSVRINIESEITFPDLTRRWVSLPPDIIDELTALFKRIIFADMSQAALSAREIATQFSDLARRLRSEENSEVGQEVLNKQFRIERVLGQGQTTRTYLASYVYSDYSDLACCVLKKFHNPHEVSKQGKNEYQTLQKIKSKYLPTITEIYPPEAEMHIKMEYIPGNTLQDLENEFPWPLEQWWNFAQELMNAIEVLEKEQLLHRDIKPENIILCENGNYPVLIDFSYATRIGVPSKVQLAGSPLYLPPEARNAEIPPSSSDRYATGILLFKMLTGTLPFELSNGFQKQPRLPEEINDPKILRLAKVLLNVVSDDPTKRPTSIEEMRQELQNALLTIEELPTVSVLKNEINPWVDNIRSLYRNSEHGNINNRGLDTDFVRETYVPTALDTELLPAIIWHRPHVVFLSGNPGDGKTAFLEQMQQFLQAQGAICQYKDASGWEWSFEGHLFRSCYDASEAHNGKSADEQLSEKLQGLEGNTLPTVALTVLVAINDGRMMDFFERHKEQFAWLAHAKDQVQSQQDMTGHPVWVIDLKQRTFVYLPHMKEASIFSKVLEKLVAPEQWAICDHCAAQQVCPLRANASALHQPVIRKRLQYLLTLTHLRRQRQMTMRDLRSALAYLITGNKNCEQIHQAREREEGGATLVNLSYWRLAFAPLEQADEVLQELIALDPARFPRPHLDRYLHFHQSIADGEIRRHLFSDGIDLPLQRFGNEQEWMAAVKRRLYFEASLRKNQPAQAQQMLPKVHALSLLPYHYAQTFVELLEDRYEEGALTEIREQLALGILRSDGVIEDVIERMKPLKLSVKVSASEEQQLVILKQLPLEDFRLYARQPRRDMLEKIPEVLILEHKSSYPRLEINLDLFELLMRLANGLTPDAPELQPLLEDLRLFKDVLLLQETRDLVLIENHYRVHHLTQREGKIVRTTLR